MTPRIARLAVILPMLAFASGSPGQPTPTQPAAKPVPRMQAVPQPYEQVSFQREGSEVARYHFGPSLWRPFVFPLVGPAGRSLTRMGHPRDPEGHGHHNSVWVSHQNVDGVNFWEDRRGGRIVHQRVERLDDGSDLPDVPDAAAVTVVNHWIGEADRSVLLVERRRTMVQLLPNDEMLLVLDLQFEPGPGRAAATLGKTPFGPIGVRMAKTLGTHDGGGVLRNSAGATGEPAIFRRPAKWVDYSGPITASATEGCTLFDHPSNPSHPSPFHVRADGWMGACLTLDKERAVEQGRPLRLRYGVFVHAGMPPVEAIEKRWEAFAETPVPDLTPKPKGKAATRLATAPAGS